MLGYFGGPPDVVVCGVNLGANMGEDVTYSGTVGAALEGALLGLPGVALSIIGRTPRHLEEMTALALPIVARVVSKGLPERVALNVNLPDCPAAAVRGVEVTGLGCASYHDRLEVEDAAGAVHRYRIHSELVDCENELGTDFAAVAHDVVSVTPLRTDWVDEPASRLLHDWRLAELVLGGPPADRTGGGERR
jgi:5'-nucleotidase